jgi:hypothetical protein
MHAKTLAHLGEQACGQAQVAPSLLVELEHLVLAFPSHLDALLSLRTKIDNNLSTSVAPLLCFAASW